MAGSIEKRLEILLMILPVAGLAVVVLGWFLGSEVMSWRALYTSNDAWKAHYSEAFRSYIRQALCCMGRYRYLYVNIPSFHPLCLFTYLRIWQMV